jgi:hypothetical protein
LEIKVIRSKRLFKPVKDGEFVTSMRYYQEKNLPYYILVNIKRKYPGKKIFGVSEISSADAILYYVKIEDDKRWMTVVSDSQGDLCVVEKFRKAS